MKGGHDCVGHVRAALDAQIRITELSQAEEVRLEAEGQRLLAALRKGDEQVSALHDALYAHFGEKGAPDWVKLGLEAVNVEVWKAHEILRAALAVEEDATPGKPETPGNSGAAVEEDAHVHD